jgi:hypothetical protein
MERREAVAVVLALTGVLGAGCATGSGSGRVLLPQASLELRQAQTRAFEGGDARAALKAAVDVLQDEGFVIREADADLGFVAGVKQWQSSSSSKGLSVLKWVAAPMTYGASLLLPAGRNEYSSLEANVNVTGETTRTRVRVSLVTKVTDKKGEMVRVETVQDPAAYQAILARMDRAVYLHEEGL